MVSVRKRRILLLNPDKPNTFQTDRLHMGLSLISQILAVHHHEVRILDYAFIRGLGARVCPPHLEDTVQEFKPDVVGITVFTYLFDECEELIEKTSRCTDAPIILGGPHFAMFPNDFREDRRVSYVVRGEVEGIIADLIPNARREAPPVFVEAPIPSPEQIPRVNLEAAIGHEYIRNYQIQLSRGCPYHCSFCTVQMVSSRRIRDRDLSVCLDQICEARQSHPSIQCVVITDDCPAYDRVRFKEFLRMFARRSLGCGLWVDNMRANLIDEEMIELYKAAGGTNVCLGVETGHPEVFAQIHKGESLPDIVTAAHLVRQHDLKLGLCFVIGLPGDNLDRHRVSMELAKSLAPDYVFWNMCIPWPGTEIHSWYKDNGEIGELRDFSTLIDPGVHFSDPVAVSRDFPKNARIKAWLMANLETHDYFRITMIGRLVPLVVKYRIYRSFGVYLRRFISRVLRRTFSRT